MVRNETRSTGDSDRAGDAPGNSAAGGKVSGDHPAFYIEGVVDVPEQLCLRHDRRPHGRKSVYRPLERIPTASAHLHGCRGPYGGAKVDEDGSLAGADDL